MSSKVTVSSKATVLSKATAATHVRWIPILALVMIATTINYLDRAIFGIARAGGMQSELNLDPVAMGYLGSAFSLTYAFAQIPAGIFLDRFGVRFTYALALIGWSAFAGLQGIAGSFATLFGYRLGLGLFETPCFPANSRILATWFPQNERARANSIYAVGQYVGTAFLSVPLVWVISQFGWRSLFFIVGGLGVLFGLYWYRKYHEPQDSKAANSAELRHIEEGGGLAPSTPRVKFTFAAAWRLTRQRQIITASVAQFCSNTVLVFFLLDFVNYLGKERHMEFLKAGIWAAFPYMAAALGVLCGGQVSDRLLKKTGSANIGRKMPIVIGLFMASSLALADFVPADNNALVIAIMCVSLFGQGICNLGWTVISDVAPKSVIGLTGGIFNFFTNLAGILTPIIIGYVLSLTNTYTAALFYVAAMPLIGAFLYIFVLGDIKRLSLD